MGNMKPKITVYESKFLSNQMIRSTQSDQTSEDV